MTEEQVKQEQQVDIQTQPIVENTVTPEPETEQQINWRKFRESKEQERKARLEAEKAMREAEQREKQRAAEADALKAAMESLLNKPTNQYNEYVEEDEDARIQKKIDEAIARKQKQYEEERVAREKQEMPQRLRQSFPDFDKICNEENVDYLEYHYPEVAVAYNHMPDSVEKWASLYKAVKKLVPNTNSQSDRAKIEKNLSKPQSVSVSGVAQVGDTAPRILDEKQKMENYKRMQRAMKMI